MMKWRYPMLACACLAILGGPLPVRGDVDVTELSSDRFGYTGTYTKYDSLSDLQNNINGTTVAVNQRDLGLFFVNNAPAYYGNTNIFTTAWYYTTTGPSDGYGNPNNTDLSFIQIYNDPSQGYSPLVGTSNAYWTSSALNQLTISASGSDANAANSAARFGDQDSANQSAPATAGTFLSYNLNATFSGLNTAVYNSITGAYESTGDPAGMTVSGTFSAIFENTSTNTASNGFYKIDLTLNNTSWAYQNIDDLTVYPFQTSLFGASSVAPEPSSFVTALVVGSLGALGYTWRRRRGASSSTAA